MAVNEDAAIDEASTSESPSTIGRLANATELETEQPSVPNTAEDESHYPTGAKFTIIMLSCVTYDTRYDVVWGHLN
jgi:hypothetical protein